MSQLRPIPPQAEQLPEEEQVRLVEQLDGDRLVGVFDEMEYDDLADLIGEMPAADQERMLGMMDVVLCRNVIIYFDVDGKRRVVRPFFEQREHPEPEHGRAGISRSRVTLDRLLVRARRPCQVSSIVLDVPYQEGRIGTIRSAGDVGDPAPQRHRLGLAALSIPGATRQEQRFRAQAVGVSRRSAFGAF